MRLLFWRTEPELPPAIAALRRMRLAVEHTGEEVQRLVETVQMVKEDEQ